MKDGIHPDYHPVVYIDVGAQWELATRSTIRTKETKEIDGVEHYIVKIDISSASHPFYTGKKMFVDAAGRVEKFRRRYGFKKGADEEG